MPLGKRCACWSPEPQQEPTRAQGQSARHAHGVIIYFQLTFHPIQQIPEGTAVQIWSLAHLDPGREGPLFPIDRFHNRPLCSVRLRLQSKQVFRLAGTPKQRQQDMGSLILSSCQPLSLNSAASCFAVTESAVTGRRYQVVLESSINCDSSWGGAVTHCELFVKDVEGPHPPI